MLENKSKIYLKDDDSVSENPVILITSGIERGHHRGVNAL